MRFTATSRCSTPIPAMIVSPLSSSILITRFGSSMVSFLKTSTNFGKSFGCFGSIAIWTTGSETYFDASNTAHSLFVDTVCPARASVNPSNAGIFPADSSPTCSLTFDMKKFTDWTRPSRLESIMLIVWPSFIFPENNRPIATGPAAGSIVMLTIIITVGPLSSQLRIDLPKSDSKSPFQIFGILYFCATCGGGWCFTTIPNTASARGAFSTKSSTLPESEYASITSLKVTPFFFMISTLIAHLSLAEPNVTLPSWIDTFHFSLYSSSAYVSINWLKFATTLARVSCIFSGVNLSSLINRSILLMYKTGLTRSSRDILVTVSVCVMIPSTASHTTTAPSIALRLLITRPEKSTCPGVSIMLMT